MDTKNQEIYNSKLVDVEEAINKINHGDTVILDMGCCEAIGIEEAIVKHYERFRDVEFYQMIVCGDTPFADPKYAGHFRYNSLFASSSNRKAIAMGYADYTPCFFYEMPEVIRDIIKPIVSICSVCPPDENGYVSLGANVDYIGSTLDYCEVKIAQVNKYVPRTLGGAVRHISEFDCLVEIDRELPDASKEVLLVLDATTGQNAVNQAKDFKDAAGITGIVLTKLDGTARGGVVLAINNELDVPVKFVGVGEQIDDLQPFDADAFAEGMFGE